MFLRHTAQTVFISIINAHCGVMTFYLFRSPRPACCDSFQCHLLHLKPAVIACNADRCMLKAEFCC
jgi:hypothetical protein